MPPSRATTSAHAAGSVRSGEGSSSGWMSVSPFRLGDQVDDGR